MTVKITFVFCFCFCFCCFCFFWHPSSTLMNRRSGAKIKFCTSEKCTTWQLKSMALSKDAAASIHRNGGAADDFVMRHGGALLHFGETFGRGRGRVWRCCCARVGAGCWFEISGRRVHLGRGYRTGDSVCAGVHLRPGGGGFFSFSGQVFWRSFPAAAEATVKCSISNLAPARNGAKAGSGCTRCETCMCMASWV